MMPVARGSSRMKNRHVSGRGSWTRRSRPAAPQNPPPEPPPPPPDEPPLNPPPPPLPEDEGALPIVPSADIIPPTSGTAEPEKMLPPLPAAIPLANDDPSDVRYQAGKYVADAMDGCWRTSSRLRARTPSISPCSPRAVPQT